MNEKIFAKNSGTYISFTSSYKFNGDSKFIEKTDFSLEEMYEQMNMAFLNDGNCYLKIIKPKSSFLEEIAMENVAHHCYRIYIYTRRAGHTTCENVEGLDWWWNPNKQEYQGTIPYEEDRGENMEFILRCTTKEIRYAQLLFYDVYKYGKLSDWSRTNFRFFLDEKN